jgi:hypothetical protein
MAECVTGHSVSIYDRGGTRPIWNMRDLSQVRWERVRDNISEASFRVQGDACSDQAGIIDALRSRRHEMRIFRTDSFGSRVVWEGPVSRVSSQDGFADVFAKDVLKYLDLQPLTQRWSNATEGGIVQKDTVTGRIEGIIDYELSHGRTVFAPSNAANDALVPGLIAQGFLVTPVTGGYAVVIPALEDTSGLLPPVNVLPYLQVHHWPNEAETTAVTEPYEFTVFEHLASLGRTSGIDYTAVGRAIHVWDVSRSLGRLPQWTEANFHGPVIVTEYGEDHTQVAYVTGQDGAVGVAVNLENLGYYGGLSTVFTAYQEEGTEDPTQSELNSQARRNTSGRSPAPVEVRVPDNSTIVLDDTLTIDKLIPGVQVFLRATLAARQIAQLQKIDHVVVTETASKETIQVTLTPATKPDDDEEEET